MAKKQYIATILLLVFFTCTACTNKDAVVKSLYSLNYNYTSKRSLTTPRLNTDSIVLLQINNTINKLLSLDLVSTMTYAATSYYTINLKHKIKTSINKLFSKNGLPNIENHMNAIIGDTIFEDYTNNGFHLTLTYPHSPYVQKSFNSRRHR